MGVQLALLVLADFKACALLYHTELQVKAVCCGPPQDSLVRDLSIRLLLQTGMPGLGLRREKSGSQ